MGLQSQAIKDSGKMPFPPLTIVDSYIDFALTVRMMEQQPLRFELKFHEISLQVNSERRILEANFLSKRRLRMFASYRGNC